MRIVSGQWKGRRITAPKNLPARPTTDYAKEALFNTLSHDLDWSHTKMIDLFAGIGSISLEALSRGAQHVISVEMHGSTIAWLKKITYELGAGSRSEIVRSEAMKWLKQYTGTADFIFADPPYAYENYQELIDLVLHHPAFNHALFVLEHRKSTRFTEHPNFAEERTYGEVRFTYFKH